MDFMLRDLRHRTHVPERGLNVLVVAALVSITGINLDQPVLFAVDLAERGGSSACRSLLRGGWTRHLTSGITASPL